MYFDKASKEERKEREKKEKHSREPKLFCWFSRWANNNPIASAHRPAPGSIFSRYAQRGSALARSIPTENKNSSNNKRVQHNLFGHPFKSWDHYYILVVPPALYHLGRERVKVCVWAVPHTHGSIIPLSRSRRNKSKGKKRNSSQSTFERNKTKTKFVHADTSLK